jgi:hypothetical protein
VERFGYKARRRMCPLYVAGLIVQGDSKTVGPMAGRVAPGDYDRLHHFVSDGVWDGARWSVSLRSRPTSWSAARTSSIDLLAEGDAEELLERRLAGPKNMPEWPVRKT